VRDIFGIRFPRSKPPLPDGDDPAQPSDAPARRSTRKPVLLLVLGFVALFFVAAVQQGDPATGKVSTTTLLAVLKDPLTLFAERSPGGRAEGALIPVKERVLSTIRERDPTGALPGVDDPVVAGLPEAPGPGGPAPEERVLSGEREGLPGGGGGAPGGFGGAPGGFGGPGFAPGPGGLIPEDFATAPPGGPGPGPGIDDPIIDGPGPGAPPPPGIFDPGASPVPEPATWAMLILGFFAIGAALRRRPRGALPRAR
jgi:hypothetical protein